ncbi:MAG: 2-dehydro-3-deoxyphosphooctonate aldolase [Ignavibacteria bacterium]|nr:2-dehydro-3-deoxyphosphooctonate aldolase [Ignavibacteria bacterium]
MNELLVIAGPCVVESKELLNETASTLAEICLKLPVKLIFKSSYKKANRSSLNSFTGIGDEKALLYLNDIGKEFALPVLTDVHSPDEARLAAGFVDVLQIPAFLSRQTELLQAAGETGKIINIKKGQFMAPDDMQKAADKVAASGNNKIWLTERGTFFGYHDLVVDFRSLLRMRSFGYPVIYDATHSLQQPSIGEISGGLRQYIPALARAAAATGIDGIFIETHPEPEKAMSDSATQLPLKEVKTFLEKIVEIHKICSEIKLSPL